MSSRSRRRTRRRSSTNESPLAQAMGFLVARDLSHTDSDDAASSSSSSSSTSSSPASSRSNLLAASPGAPRPGSVYRDFSVTTSGLAVLVLFAVLVRCGVGGSGHSGEASPPLYGDYEAQRHWMEVTVNLPVHEWYYNTTHNDLLYWGLDYPPLTAYVSWACGHVARVVVPELVELHTSRGVETPETKLFMRWTVIVCDLLIWFPAVFLFFRLASDAKSRRDEHLGFVLLLLHPAFVLVDHGHFQYNGVSLGLTLLAVTCVLRGSRLLGSSLFCLAIMFKQMSLYFAPAFFFFLLGEALQLPSRRATLRRVLSLGVVVLATFALSFLPFLYIDLRRWLAGEPLAPPEPLDPNDEAYRNIPAAGSATWQVVQRMFPFARGLYEDKVANFWCTTSVLIKWKQRFERATMTRITGVATLAALLPSSLDVLRRPTPTRFLFALANSAFAFFFFSFQVHEKSVLLPLLPLCLFIHEQPRLVAWVGVIATSSMFPLLERDGQALPYFVLQFLYIWAGVYCAPPPAQPRAISFAKVYSPWIVNLSMLGLFALHVGTAVMPDIPRLPDLKPLLFTAYAFAHLFPSWLWLNYLQMSLPSKPLTSPTAAAAAAASKRRPKTD